MEYTGDNGPNRVSSPQTRLETSGTGMGQNGIVLADVTEYIYLPQSTFTHTLCFILDKKKDGGWRRGINGRDGVVVAVVSGGGKGVTDEEDGK